MVIKLKGTSNSPFVEGKVSAHGRAREQIKRQNEILLLIGELSIVAGKNPTGFLKSSSAGQDSIKTMIKEDN